MTWHVRTTRLSRVLVVGLLAGLSSAGCSSRTESYCDTLQNERQTLTGLATSAGRSGGALFDDSLEVFESLRDQAPDDIRDEWDTYVFAWQGVAAAFDRAGTTPQEYGAGDRPRGVSAAEAEAIEDAAGDLSSDRVQEAARGIEQHARDVCKVDLGL